MTAIRDQVLDLLAQRHGFADFAHVAPPELMHIMVGDAEALLVLIATHYATQQRARIADENSEEAEDVGSLVTTCLNPHCVYPGTVFVGHLTDAGDFACSLDAQYVESWHDGDDDA